LNPYKNASWYMWFHSLRWLGQGIIAAGNGDLTALTRVNTIAYDWYRDNPYSWKANIGAWESTMHRTNVLICLRQAILSGLEFEAGVPPAELICDEVVEEDDVVPGFEKGYGRVGSDITGTAGQEYAHVGVSVGRG